MSEPDIIHSNHPHQVSIPEGSHVAVAKTATAQEPSVHKNYRPGTGEEQTDQVPDRFSPDAREAPPPRPVEVAVTQAPERTDLAKAPLTTPDDARVHQVPSAQTQRIAPSAPQASVPAQTNPAPSATQDLPPAADSLDEHASPEGLEMPEMDFPARVVHLRIENEELRTRLEKLETDL